jgi:leucyl/phenylalanyl-tRNA--protein transferase
MRGAAALPLPDWDRIVDRAKQRDLIAVGGALDADHMLGAYRAGVFPWPIDDSSPVPWFCPVRRTIIPVTAVHVPRSLRRLMRRSTWTVRLDTATDEVVAACADRSDTWITPRMRLAVADLAERGAAHSVEVFDGDRLIGGLYAIASGAIWSGESMFHRVSGASKVAVLATVHLLAGAGGLALDVQQASSTSELLGAVDISRADFLSLVRAGRDLPVSVDTAELPVSEILARNYSATEPVDS